MSEGLTGLTGVVIGGAIVMVADWLRHRRLRKERLQEMLLQRRTEAYAELAKSLSLLYWALPLEQLGLELMRWPKDRRLSPRYFENVPPDQTANREQEKQLASDLCQMLNDLKRFAHAHRLELAANVQKAFWRGYASIEAWRRKANIYSDADLQRGAGQSDLVPLIKRSFEKLIEDTEAAIFHDLDVHGFRVLGVAELEGAVQAGRDDTLRCVERPSPGDEGHG